MQIVVFSNFIYFSYEESSTHACYFYCEIDNKNANICKGFLFPYVIYPNAISKSQLSFGKYQTDEQAWVDTIKSVGLGETVRISTMDWLGQSQYTTQKVYWSALSSAISEVHFGYSANCFEHYFHRET